jgi:hypothetical protein
MQHSYQNSSAASVLEHAAEVSFSHTPTRLSSR